MKCLPPVVASLAVLTASGSVAADPPAPAPEVAVLVAGAGMTAFAEDTLNGLAPEDGGGLFRRAAPAFRAADFEACGATGVQPEVCVREVLAARGAAALEGPPTVVVWVGPGPGFLTGWTCIGVGEGPTAADRQSVSLDWSSPGGGDNAGKAGSCILAAAAESGW